MNENNMYNGLYFSDKLMKEHGSAKACYEFVKGKEQEMIISFFDEWYDNYVKCMNAAPNGTLGIFYAPFPQHPEINEEYFNSWKKFIFDSLDKIILFLNMVRFFILSPDFGREEKFKDDWDQIIYQAHNVFDIYLSNVAKNIESYKNTDTDLLQNIFNKEFNSKDDRHE